jgi:hypothetical protein
MSSCAKTRARLLEIADDCAIGFVPRTVFVKLGPVEQARDE